MTGSTSLLKNLRSPQDLKQLPEEKLDLLAQEIRKELVATVAKRGGHLSSNLGVVELTIALHRVFNLPEDKLIFDVGHQSYVHKLLTGRYWRFHTLRTFGGLSGFPKRSESVYDAFETGHASTAISAALGMARARDFQHQTHQVVALVGDGALTGGLSYEALNDAGNSKTRLIVILNDNEMSIAPNVGALSRHLTDLRMSKGWISNKKRVKTGLEKLPLIGKPLYRFVHLSKGFIKSLIVDEGFFSALGFHYYGPIDGHDIRRLEKTLRLAQGFDGPVVIHVLTQKGHGYDKAEEAPERFHGIAPFVVETGQTVKQSEVPPFGSVMAEELCALAREDDRVVAVTAAMAAGTGLDAFAKEFPDRIMDVGIAEGHATTMAAGMAAGGMRPYFAVYASFFQRAFDQLVHDVCLQRLPVTFLIDRCGLVGEDGATHHGVLTFSSLLPVPYLTLLAPRDEQELRAMMRYSAESKGPLAVCYGREGIDQQGKWPYRGFRLGRWEVLQSGTDCAILAVGSMVASALEVSAMLDEQWHIKSAVVNCSSLKPMDTELLRAMNDRPLITLEEGLVSGGFGCAVNSFCVEEGLNPPVINIGLPDTFVQHGTRAQLLKYLSLQPAQLARRIMTCLKE